MAIFSGHKSTITSLSGHGNHLVSSSSDHTIRMWQIVKYNENLKHGDG
eukprot:CAMPEP_0201557114 /NCGR_PEP_ID=MMETSP0173_2-20130828/59705_1 /ASSEMBLY_ACC=CAM_ASM_000268 /TAXON_ID=218659 /ORGANISM="Vexillifera sp., Strain DIVA3 564/2" /LENGTH=47 /DNA_ID= /DNA_START= /DNA_END= /DNA_ORIENTATION=